MGDVDLPEPSPDAVRDAVTATGDPELTALTAEPGSYVLRPAPRQGERTRLFHVMPVATAHPMAFVIAVDGDSGRATVTTGRPDAVREVVAADPALRTPDAVWELIRDEQHGGLVAAELAGGAAGGEGRYEFRVRDRDTDGVVRWRLQLSGHGSTWQRAG